MSVVSPLQVAAVREGMSSIVPVPLLSLYTAKMVEMAVRGYEEVDTHTSQLSSTCVCPPPHTHTQLPPPSWLCRGRAKAQEQWMTSPHAQLPPTEEKQQT